MVGNVAAVDLVIDINAVASESGRMGMAVGKPRCHMYSSCGGTEGRTHISQQKAEGGGNIKMTFCIGTCRTATS